MKTPKFILIASALVFLGIAGCTQMPTESTSISDLRPQISFKTDNESSQGARVFVDGLEVGFVRDFLSGTNSLLILPGNHVLQVKSSDRTLLDEHFYIGDGVVRSFTLR